MAQAQCKEDNFPPVGAWWEGYDPGIFFPERGRLGDVDKARWTCYVCPVRKECDAYRVKTGSNYGIWAGEFKEGDEEESTERVLPVDVVPDIIDVLQLEL